MIPRPYQQKAFDAMIAHVLSSLSPALIDAAPAAGKSFMIAMLADYLHKRTNKKVLCLAPSAVLVKQNLQKFLMTGSRASMFSASAGRKELRFPVVFGSPLTVKNKISRFKEGYCAVICDEVHGLTPTILEIIDQMREGNPNLRVIGLTGTPYRLKSGYIFREWPDGKINGEDTAQDPYFSKCVYRVSAREMLDGGFITPMRISKINSAAYDTSKIRILANGQANPHDVECAFEGHGRKTSAIVADVIQNATGRFGGVMYFAATVQHAHEILASLPPENSALVTGDDCILRGTKASRDEVIRQYSEMKFRHLVSVGTLTTGFDVSHTSTIALLRFTESAALLTQILGRAWRLHNMKPEAVLLDYAGNIGRHFPDGDIYSPDIRAGNAAAGDGGMTCVCPSCAYENSFTANPLYLAYRKDEAGYILDLDGHQVMSDFGPISAHFGRRCLGLVQSGKRGEYERCGYRWTFKECPHCQGPNDIAARYCITCKGEIVDPNEKLVADFKALKKDPTRLQTDKVVSMSCAPGVSRSGNRTMRVEWVTPYRQFATWFMPEATNVRGIVAWQAFDAITLGGKVAPRTVTYIKDAGSGFFDIRAYNRAADEGPDDKPEPEWDPFDDGEQHAAE